MIVVGLASGARAPEPLLAGVPRSEIRERRLAAMRAMPDGVLVVRGSSEDELDDLTKFRQNNWFLYLTGAEAPGAFLVLDPRAPEGARELLYLPPRNPLAERWTGPKVGPGPETAERYGVDDARPVEALDEDLRAVFKNGAGSWKVYTIVPNGAGARYTREAGVVERLQDLIGPERRQIWTVADAVPVLAALRRTKSQVELGLLQRAIDITVEAQREVARTVAPGRFEYEVEAAIVAAFRRNGAQRPGFPPIVGSGPNSTVLHYDVNSRRMEEGELVVVDIGAEYDYYTADVTRTWPVSGRFTPRQREVYELVLSTQLAAERAYRPGMSMQSLHLAAVEHMRQSKVRDARGGTLDAYFIHGLGHFLGMDVHDVGDRGQALKPGDVITIEPGIYIPDEHLGVRIEDDYLVTAKGLVKLSKAIPSAADEIERLVQKERGRR